MELASRGRRPQFWEARALTRPGHCGNSSRGWTIAMPENLVWVVVLGPGHWLGSEWKRGLGHCCTDSGEVAAVFSSEEAARRAMTLIQRWAVWPSATVRRRVDNS